MIKSIELKDIKQGDIFYQEEYCQQLGFMALEDACIKDGYVSLHAKEVCCNGKFTKHAEILPFGHPLDDSSYFPDLFMEYL